MDLDAVISAVMASAKYRTVCPELVRDLAARELAGRSGVREAARAVRNRLHQAAGAYMEGRPDYGPWSERIRAASGDPDELKAVCRSIMARHASTRERLPILDGFYGALLEGLGPVRSVLDLGCGLNPLTVPWMPAGLHIYTACDIYADMTEFVRGIFPLAGVEGRALVWNLLAGAPEIDADVTLALKILPPLELMDRSASLRLLRSVRSRALAVSFPASSLGGRSRGMTANYSRRFGELIESEPWSARRVDFPGELAFVLTR
jgi:16S rRNA (guanine(1405)-N(7))-methyltransferase